MSNTLENGKFRESSVIIVKTKGYSLGLSVMLILITERIEKGGTCPALVPSSIALLPKILKRRKSCPPTGEQWAA